MSSAFFPHSPLFFSSCVVEDRHQAAQGGLFVLRSGVRGKREMGLEGEGERLKCMLRRGKSSPVATSIPGPEHGGGP